MTGLGGKRDDVGLGPAPRLDDGDGPPRVQWGGSARRRQEEGQVGLDPATGELVGGGIEAETERALKNLAAVLDAAGCSLGDVVKTTCFLADIADFATFNAIYGRFFPDPPPARSTFEVAALPKGARIEIEAVAVRERA